MKTDKFIIDNEDTQLQLFKTKYNEVIIRIITVDEEEEEETVVGTVLSKVQLQKLAVELIKLNQEL